MAETHSDWEPPPGTQTNRTFIISHSFTCLSLVMTTFKIQPYVFELESDPEYDSGQDEQIREKLLTTHTGKNNAYLKIKSLNLSGWYHAETKNAGTDLWNDTYCVF